MAGSLGVVRGDSFEHWFIPSIEANKKPLRSSSFFEAASVSEAVGANDTAETVGIESQDGGPNVVEYSGSTFDIFM